MATSDVTDQQQTGRARHRSPVAAAAVALLVGGVLVLNGTDAPAGPPQPEVTTVEGTVLPDAPPSPPPPPPAEEEKKPEVLGRSAPVRLDIDAADVAAPVTPVGLDRTGGVDVPEPKKTKTPVGWWKDGVTPGENGTAVMTGHVDTHSGPSVFYNLGALKKGAGITVKRADGKTAKFTVDAIEVYNKKGFPSKRVYGDTGRPELRLITCGGGFDKKKRSGGYSGNVVVFAHYTGTA